MTVAAAAQVLPPDWQAGFLAVLPAVLPAVQTHAQIQFRRLPAARRGEAVADRNAGVPDTACLRVDFQRWLAMLGRRDRRIITAFAGGDGTGAVAGPFGLSPARVSQLRRRYEALWRVFHGEPA